jgi:DNA-binding response OmpR family regulator
MKIGSELSLEKVTVIKMSQAKILVVDDEVEIARAVTIRLRAAGYEVIVAHDGMMATQLAMREAPDLVIMDIGMPCGDGHVITQRLRDNVETMSTPIIYLTARTAEVDRKRATENRAVGYLTKPFKAEELLATVSHALSVRKMRTGSTHAVYTM